MSTRCQIEFYSDHPKDVVETHPDARIYKHSDGYPEHIIPMLEKLFEILSRNLPMYGSRENDSEWSAAEFVNEFRYGSSQPAQDPCKNENYQGYGNIYVTQNLHPDIEFLYRVTCHSGEWHVDIFEPKFEPYPGDKLVSLEAVERWVMQRR